MQLGFGTWQIEGGECVEAVHDALEIGYRHLDTARAYGNERDVGAGIARSGVPREEVFLTTKVWMDDAAPERVERSAAASLRDLGTDYVDLLLLHWPNADVPLERTIEAMTRVRDEGGARNIGVSNFPPDLLERALDAGPIFCDQIEYHPLLGQQRLLEIAAKRDLMITAYAPLAHGKLKWDTVLAEIGDAHGKTAAQVALRWLVEQPHVTTVPKAASHENRVANFDIWDFELSDGDRTRIEALPKDGREFNPSWAPDWDA